MTKNGKLIQEMIRSSRTHPTADEIYMMMRGSGHGMSLATVYNNLASLTEEGLLRKITTPSQPDRYDLLHMRHDHLLCARCGRISDLYLSDFTEMLENETGITISSYDLKLIYVCDECKNKQKKEDDHE